MGDIVNLRSIPIDLLSDVGRQFVVDATRAGEGLITDQELAAKYELSPADFQNIAKDVALGRAIRAEGQRRTLSGVAAKEAASKHHVRAQTILAGILESGTNPRYVIEAAREIRAVASGGNGADRQAETERPFVIHIDLGGGHVVHREFDKPMKIDTSAEDGPNNLIEGKPDVDDQW